MKVTIHGVDRSADYTPDELSAISISFVADKGEVGSGILPVPDPAGTLEPYAGYRVLLEDVGLSTTVFDGLVGSLSRERGTSMIGNRLVHSYTIADQNAFLDGHRAVNWKRPAETDVARITAFVTDFLGYLSLDTTWLLGTHAQTIPAKTYTTESLYSELQTDCGTPTGKTMFIEGRRFHWHLPTEGIIADIAIVEAESADYNNSFPAMSQNPPIRQKDPMDLATDVMAINSKGYHSTATDSTAATRHDSDGARHQVLIDSPDSTPTQLATIAAQALADRKAERITYEGEIGPMNAAHVARLPVGCLINVTDHVWGLSSSTQRLAASTLRYIHPNLYMMHVELGYPVRIRANPPVTTPPDGHGLNGEDLPPFVCDIIDFTVPTCSGGDGHALAIGPITGLEGGAFPSESSLSVRLYHGAYYRVSFTATHATTNFECNLDYDVQAGLVAGTFGNLPPMPSPIPPIDSVVSYMTGNSPGGPGTSYCVPGTIYQGAGYAGCNCVGAAGTVEFTYISGPDPRFVALGRCVNGEPMPGQKVEDPVFLGDGVTTSYTTMFPYKPGSLHFEDNGKDWTPTVTEVDPTAGTYTLAYPPPLGSTVIVEYEGAP